LVVPPRCLRAAAAHHLPRPHALPHRRHPQLLPPLPLLLPARQASLTPQPPLLLLPGDLTPLPLCGRLLLLLLALEMLWP
jgi:hypothetical protein